MNFFQTLFCHMVWPFIYIYKTAAVINNHHLSITIILFCVYIRSMFLRIASLNANHYCNVKPVNRIYDTYYQCDASLYFVYNNYIIIK